MLCTALKADHLMTSCKAITTDADSQVKVRASVSLPQTLHAELQQLARDKRVSLAWVIRDAAEKYVAVQTRACWGAI